MIIQWGIFKLRAEPRFLADNITVQVVVCEHCGAILKNPHKPIFAIETGFAYCSHDCATEDVKEVAKRMKEENPEWSGF